MIHKVPYELIGKNFKKSNFHLQFTAKTIENQTIPKANACGSLKVDA